LKDLNNIFILSIVAFVAIVAIASMLIAPSIPSINYRSSDSFGHAINIYQNFSQTINTFSSPNLLDLSTTDNLKALTFSISDDAVFNTAYISINGTAWQPITLTGTVLSGNWLQQTSTGTYNILRTNIPNNTGTDNYIITYTCTKNTTTNPITWNCHNNKWQIRPFNTTKKETNAQTPSGTTWTGELMNNGGFETGDFTGWTTVKGAYSRGFAIATTGNALYIPQAGNHVAYFDGSPSDATGVDFYIYQDVDLTPYADSIDAGTAYVNASAWGASSETPPNGGDTTRIQIMFLDSNRNVMQTAKDSTGLRMTNNAWWQTAISDVNIPKNVRYIRMWATSYDEYNNKFDESGSMDSFSVKVGYGEALVNPPACTSHSYSQCDSSTGDIYWFNSCNVKEDILTDCTPTQTCSNNACINPSSALNTFYISSIAGSDSAGNGSTTNPWKTLATACANVKTSGSIIHVTSGTYTESSQCSLASGVSIEGEGSSSTTIKSTITNAPTIYLYSSSVTNGNQHISGIKMDGNNLAAYEPLVIDKRSNVEVHDCVFVNFYFSGVSFYGENLGNDVQPNNFCLNNKFYNNVITNCASFDPSGSPGNLQIDSQQGMRVYNNVITQTARGAGADGFVIKCFEGLNKDMKVYNNTITIDNDDEAQFDFAMEFWDSLGGIEIYDNRVQGVIDLAGHFGRNGTSPYTYSVHDNILGPDTLKTTSRHGIYLENTNDLSDIYIYKNRLQNLNNPIKIETWTTASFSNIQIYYNVFYNVGTVGGGWNTNGFSEGNEPGFTLDNLKFYNNVFIAATVAGANPISAIQIPGKGTTTNVEIKNNIIMNFNSAISTGYSGGTIRDVTIASNILYNNDATISWDGTKPAGVSESNTITSNPLFVSSTDFHLQSKSPAINNGNNVDLTSDYEGNPVPYPIGEAPDIGAYEYR
jgi:hypothetical protein